LFDQNFTKTERSVTNDLIVTPSKEKVTEFLEASGALPNTNKFLASFSFSLSAEFPLSKKLLASPYAEFLLPLNRPADYWHFRSVHGGLTFKWLIDEHVDTVFESHHEQIPVRIEIPEEKKPLLTAS